MSFDIRGGNSIGIVGESGSGNTTLGRMVLGALTPTAGVVSVDGRAWRAAPPAVGDVRSR